MHWLTTAGQNELASDFINLVIIFPMDYTYKIIIDARLLNALTDVSRYHFALLPGLVLRPRLNGTIFSTINLYTANHQVALAPKTQKHHFVVGKEQYKYKRGCYGLKTVRGFITR